MASAELIENLEEIARIKESLPRRSRGWCSELGLYVQIREAGGMARLQAGGKFRSRIDLWRESPNDLWQVKKYKPGDWDALVEPTLELAKWLEVRGGVGNHAKREFRFAIRKFHDTGHLILPEGVGSFTVESVLGRIVATYPGSSRDWSVDMVHDVEMQLQSYLRSNPGQAAAWEALANVYVPLGQFKDTLYAIEEAIRIAPGWADFHFEAGGIYIAAVKNALTPVSQVEQFDDSIVGCTLDALQCSYEDARTACIKHFRAALESSYFHNENDRTKIQQVLSWCESTPMLNVYENFPPPTELNRLSETNRYGCSSNNDEPLNESQMQFGMFVSDQTVRLSLKNIREDPTGTLGEGGIPVHITIVHLLIGMSLARRYPDKAKVVLIQERYPSLVEDMDMSEVYGLWRKLAGPTGEKALFQSIGEDYRKNFEDYGKTGEGGSWILKHSLLRIVPLLFENPDIHEAWNAVGLQSSNVGEALLGVIKDGIGYILFLPRASLLCDFHQELKQNYNIDTAWIDGFVDSCIQAYENEYGVI